MKIILAFLHPAGPGKNPERIHHYQPYKDELNFDGIEFCVTIDKFEKYERQNNISANVFGFEDVLLPVHITKQRFDTHVDLLLYSRDSARHYCLITDLNKLLYFQNKHQAHMYYCPYCLHGFAREDLLQDHKPYCSQHGPQRVERPNEDNSTLYFKDYYKQLKVPFVIYADLRA